MACNYSHHPCILYSLIYVYIYIYIHIYIYIYIYIPGTQMTSIFDGQPLKTRSFPTKRMVIWVPGIYIYRCTPKLSLAHKIWCLQVIWISDGQWVVSVPWSSLDRCPRNTAKLRLVSVSPMFFFYLPGGDISILATECNLDKTVIRFVRIVNRTSQFGERCHLIRLFSLVKPTIQLLVFHYISIGKPNISRDCLKQIFNSISRAKEDSLEHWPVNSTTPSSGLHDWKSCWHYGSWMANFVSTKFFVASLGASLYRECLANALLVFELLGRQATQLKIAEKSLVLGFKE